MSKGVVFDGQWNTKGVSILGSNVIVTDCSFFNTKGTLSNYRGLTSSLLTGKYQDLKENRLNYHDIVIKDCLLEGCVPVDNLNKASENKTAARCILSYGCNNLRIEGFTFNKLEGYYDSDFIQIRSFEVPCHDFPYFDDNTLWQGPTHPFPGNYYADAPTIIQNCNFYQSDCKSSIKVMASKAIIKKNRFIVSSGQDGESYSVVRIHRARKVTICNNYVDIKTGRVNNIFTMEKLMILAYIITI